MDLLYQVCLTSADDRGCQYKLPGPGGPEGRLGPDYVAYKKISIFLKLLIYSHTANLVKLYCYKYGAVAKFRKMQLL
jgi:hypothetical protein